MIQGNFEDVNMCEYKEINDKVRKLREYLHLSKNEFGEKIGYSSTQIRQFEIGGTNPSEAVLNRICEVFLVDNKYFSGKLKLEDAVKGLDKEENKINVAFRLKETRIEKGLSINELSRKSGVGSSNISRLEKHEGALTVKTASKLAEALGVGTSWLLDGNIGEKEYPVEGRLYSWLLEHPEVREELWKQMEDEGNIC